MNTEQDQELERLKQRRDKERSEAVSFRCVIPPTWNDIDLLLNRLAQVEQERSVLFEAMRTIEHPNVGAEDVKALKKIAKQALEKL